MKRFWKFALFAFCTAFISTGCDNEEMEHVNGLRFHYCAWKNDSQYAVTLDMELNDMKIIDYVTTDMHVEMELFPGGFYDYSYMAPTFPFYVHSINRLKARFDDGTESYEVEFTLWRENISSYPRGLPLDYDRSHNLLEEQNYVSSKVNSPEGCEKCPGTRWTYTFTDADFEAAKAWVESHPEQPTEQVVGASFKAKLDDYIGVYFTRQEFDRYCEMWE